MKEWTKPDVSELDVKATASGSEPTTKEENGGLTGGGFRVATYDAVNYEKCDNGSVTLKKKSTKS